MAGAAGTAGAAGAAGPKRAAAHRNSKSGTERSQATTTRATPPGAEACSSAGRESQSSARAPLAAAETPHATTCDAHVSNVKAISLASCSVGRPGGTNASPEKQRPTIAKKRAYSVRTERRAAKGQCDAEGGGGRGRARGSTAAVKHDQHRREAGLHAGVGAAGGHLLRRARLDVDSVEPQAGRGGGRVEHRPQGCGGEARAAEREARQEGRPPRSRQRERVPKDRAGGEPARGRQPAREARQREARRPKRARLPLSLPAPALDDDSRAALKVDARPSRRACSLRRLQLDVTLSGWEAPELPRRLDRGRL